MMKNVMMAHVLLVSLLSGVGLSAGNPCGFAGPLHLRSYSGFCGETRSSFFDKP
jgi:hypothetical protein